MTEPSLQLHAVAHDFDLPEPAAAPLFDPSGAYTHARVEMWSHLEPTNRTVLLEALARKGIALLTLYKRQDSVAQLEIAPNRSEAATDNDIPELNDLIELAIVGNDLKLVRIIAPLIQALKLYCATTLRLQNEVATHNTLQHERFIFDVANGIFVFERTLEPLASRQPY